MQTIIFNGQSYWLCDEPLATMGSLPDFDRVATGSGPAYSAVWAVVANRLFVVSITGHVLDDSREAWDIVFPNVIEPVFADWYTGILKLGDGQSIVRPDGDVVFEFEKNLIFTNGVLVGLNSVRNNLGDSCSSDPILLMPVHQLDLIKGPVVAQLNKAKISTVGDMVQYSAVGLVYRAGLCDEDVGEIEEILATYGLSLGMNLVGWK